MYIFLQNVINTLKKIKSFSLNKIVKTISIINKFNTTINFFNLYNFLKGILYSESEEHNSVCLGQKACIYHVIHRRGYVIIPTYPLSPMSRTVFLRMMRTNGSSLLPHKSPNSHQLRADILGPTPGAIYKPSFIAEPNILFFSTWASKHLRVHLPVNCSTYWRVCWPLNFLIPVRSDVYCSGKYEYRYFVYNIY
jgi:hypothetical protein